MKTENVSKEISEAKAFVLWGGYGGHNLGDEAILRAMSDLLRKLRPKAKQYVIVRQEISAKTSESYVRWDIELVKAGSLRCLQVLRSARLVVGGGQLVDDKTLGWPVGWTSLFVLANRMLGQKPIILCIGAEPIRRRLTVGLVKYIYSLASVCTCRDAETADILRAAGVPSAKVWSAKDAVFALDRNSLPVRPARNAAPKIAILIAKDSNRLPESIERLDLLVDALLRNGFRVQLVAHDLREEYDLGALRAFQVKYRTEPNVITQNAGTVEEILEIYSQCDAVISARMHPLILSSLVGALPIAIARTNKVRALVENLGVPVLILDDDPESQTVQIAGLLAHREQYSQVINQRSREFGEAVEAACAEALIQ